MLKRLINKIMKIKTIDSKGVERYETHKEYQERIKKECDELIAESKKQRELWAIEREELMREYMKTYEEYMKTVKELKGGN
ncbi:MAG: hypothetical protein E7E64_08750 [Clostridium celatum]|nr:hypothetical protein [Clostridium celatum]MDU4978851.1 hypothetical protein [Clostridium celatum]